MGFPCKRNLKPKVSYMLMISTILPEGGPKTRKLHTGTGVLRRIKDCWISDARLQPAMHDLPCGSDASKEKAWKTGSRKIWGRGTWKRYKGMSSRYKKLGNLSIACYSLPGSSHHWRGSTQPSRLWLGQVTPGSLCHDPSKGNTTGTYTEWPW